MAASIEDVAKLAGVSIATVSRSLRGLPDVATATRDRVLAAAQELDYGASPFADCLGTDLGLEPVMTLTTSVIALRRIARGETVGYGGTWVASRDTAIAIVAGGYGDGMHRSLAPGTTVLVDGRRAPLAGRVSMDMLAVDVSGLESVRIGTPVVLWGAGLPVEEQARRAGILQQKFKELLGNLVCPMQVLDRKQHGSVLAEAIQQPKQCFEQAALCRFVAGHGRGPVGEDRQQRDAQIVLARSDRHRPRVGVPPGVRNTDGDRMRAGGDRRAHRRHFPDVLDHEHAAERHRPGNTRAEREPLGGGRAQPHARP